MNEYNFIIMIRTPHTHFGGYELMIMLRFEHYFSQTEKKKKHLAFLTLRVHWVFHILITLTVLCIDISYITYSTTSSDNAVVSSSPVTIFSINMYSLCTRSMGVKSIYLEGHTEIKLYTMPRRPFSPTN